MLNSPLMTVMTNAVRKAARGIVRDFGEVEKLQISKKGAANFVTNADLRTEKILVEELQRTRPKFSFLTEESGEILGKENMNRFVIDPIDGTTNFIHAIPYISISLAAQQRNANGEWETTHGIVYDPIHDELFVAEKGQGAYLENIRLRVSGRAEDFLLSTSSPRKWREGFQDSLERFQRAIELGAVVRCSGSAALDLAYVAAGRLDGMWYNRLNAWDMAAGALIVQEAGGRVSDLEGQPISNERGSLIAANRAIYDPLFKALQG
jgi:myo-inositol-1(or 4)-monophosphatase